MKHLVTQPHAILSLDNPIDPAKVTSPITHEEAIEALKQAGQGEVHELLGVYNKPERSILVSNPSEEQMAMVRDLANKKGQESHIESDGMSHKLIFNHGPAAGAVHTGKGTQFHGENPPDNFVSFLPDGTAFTHNFGDEQDVKKTEPLNKSPMDSGVDPNDENWLEANSLGHWQHRFNSALGPAKHKTTKLNNGLYHHVVKGTFGRVGPTATAHILSTDQEGEEPIAHLTVENKTYGQQVGESVVNKEHRGKDIGKGLYLLALKHHKELESDDMISPGANKVYQKLAQHPKVEAKLDSYPEGSSTHKLKYIPKKLAASELEKGAMQRLAPFKPKPKGNNADEATQQDLIHHWQGYLSDARAHREKIKQTTGSARDRFLHKLSAQTKTRRGKDGKREFLLHRGMNPEKEAENGYKETPTHLEQAINSSWTPSHDIASSFAQGDGHHKAQAPRSAWIHEDKILTVPKQFGNAPSGSLNRGKNAFGGEHEVIVGPHKSEKEDHKKTNIVEPKENLNERITQRGQQGYAHFQAPSKILSYRRDVPKKLAASELEKSTPPTQVKINPEHGKIIADAYDKMQHNPNHPEVKAAYGALINETGKQFKDMLSSGLKISKIKPGQSNPYPTSKHMHEDIKNNNHLWYFPTEQGYGSEGDAPKDHPLLQPTNFRHEGKHMVANDVFRIVHDINGHHLGGESGFGPKGEHQAFLQHKKSYSPLAQKALASETMGQNNWVNWSRSHGASNRANPAKTRFADQKAGLLPDNIINANWHKE